MKNLTSDLEGMPAWAGLFDSADKFQTFDDVDIQIQLFADGDASWMLLSHYTSDTSSTDYAFLPAREEDLPEARRYTFDFLRTVNYSLPQLLSWLETAPFVDTDITDEVTVGKIRITRNYARATEQIAHHASAANALLKSNNHIQF